MAILIFLLPYYPVYAQYPVSDIADSLKSDTLAVVRDNNIHFTFISLKKNVYSVRKVITVLKSQATNTLNSMNIIQVNHHS